MIQTNVLTKIDTLINSRNISWPWGIQNAHLVLEYACGFNCISDLLFDPEMDFSGELNLKNTCTKSNCVSFLGLQEWSYNDFVVSALLFSIRYELEQKRAYWFSLVKTLNWLLMSDERVGEEVFTILHETHVFSIFREECLRGVLSFFEQNYLWGGTRVTLGGRIHIIQRFLALFDFPDFFALQCMHDCVKEKSAGPLLLALYVQSFKTLDGSEIPKIERYEGSSKRNFESFKSGLIRTKTLSRNFFVKLLFQKEQVKNFYNLNFKKVKKWNGLEENASI